MFVRFVGLGGQGLLLRLDGLLDLCGAFLSKKDHPRPSFPEATRLNEVKRSLNRGTPRSTWAFNAFFAARASFSAAFLASFSAFLAAAFSAASRFSWALPMGVYARSVLAAGSPARSGAPQRFGAMLRRRGDAGRTLDVNSRLEVPKRLRLARAELGL